MARWFSKRRLEYRREDECNRDKGHVDGDERHHTLHAGLAKVRGGQMTRVRPLQKLDPCIRAKTAGDLPVTSVHGDYLDGAALQHAIGESAGGGANVEARALAAINVPVVESSLQLQTAAAHIPPVLAQNSDLRIPLQS